ncbi:MAG TPA: sulfur carrier protein ThiS [Firmicutes bacterium]|nr:sulfur carrier protein ThiS [Bacillota bacterium]
MKCSGKEIHLEAPVSVRAFLLEQGYQPERVAVERNGQIVRRADFDKELLREEDTVEIVHFVGGG